MVLSVAYALFELSSFTADLMRTSCHRPGADSIEYTSGGDALVFYGFRWDLFQALLIADVLALFVSFIFVLLWTFSTTSVISQ